MQHNLGQQCHNVTKTGRTGRSMDGCGCIPLRDVAGPHTNMNPKLKPRKHRGATRLGHPSTRGQSSFNGQGGPRCGTLTGIRHYTNEWGGWARNDKKTTSVERRKQKLRQGSTSVCKSGAQEYCNRTWEFILRMGLHSRRGKQDAPNDFPVLTPHA